MGGAQLGLARASQLSQKTAYNPGTTTTEADRKKKKSSLLTEQGIKKNVALCVNLVTGVAEFVRGGEKQSIGSPGRKIKIPPKSRYVFSFPARGTREQ